MHVELKLLAVLLVFTGLQLDTIACIVSVARPGSWPLDLHYNRLYTVYSHSILSVCIIMADMHVHVMDEWMACISKYNILHLQCFFNICACVFHRKTCLTYYSSQFLYTYSIHGLGAMTNSTLGGQTDSKCVSLPFYMSGIIV